MNPQDGQPLEQNQGSSVTMDAAHRFRVPLPPRTATSTLGQQHFLVPAGFGVGVGSIIHGSLSGNNVRHMQAWNPAHFIRGTGPVVQQQGMPRLNNMSNVNPANLSPHTQIAYNQAIVRLPAGITGPILLSQTPHGIIIHRRIQPPQVYELPHDQQHQLVQRPSQRITSNITSLQRTQHDYPMSLQSDSMKSIPATVVTQAEPNSSVPEGAMRNNSYAMSVATVGSFPGSQILPTSQFQSLPAVQSGQSQQRILLRSPQLRGLVFRCPEPCRSNSMVPRTQPMLRPIIQCSPRMKNVQLPIVLHDGIVSDAAAGIPRASASIRTPHIVMFRSPKEPQAQQVQFSQLPGLNFNRTTEQNEGFDSPKHGDSKVPTSRKRRPTKSMVDVKVLGPTWRKGHLGRAHSSHTISNRSNSSSALLTMTESKSYAKKRKAQTDDYVVDQYPAGNESMRDNVCQNDCDASKIAKGGKKMLLANSTVNDKESTRSNPSEIQNTPRRSNDEMSPAGRLIQKELKETVGGSTLMKRVQIYVDARLCNHSGVYVFNVRVFEKDDNTTDFPSIKMQVTEDYPAELPVFLDFQTVARSISNKTTRERFEHAVRIFKKKLHEKFCMGEYQLRIPTLVQVWYLALKETSSIPISIFNA